MRFIEGKVVILGSKGVGKTSLITNYMRNARQMPNDIQPTAAVSIFTCKVNLDNCKVILQIWDTVGQERFRAVTPLYYRNANAAILVFDLADYVTFKETKSWIQELHRHVLDPIFITLVGNKLDLYAKRVVSRDEAFLFATSNGASYMECSADSGQGLDQVFMGTAYGLLRLANDGISRTLRQYNSNETIYTPTNTAYSYMKAALSNSQLLQSNTIAPITTTTVAAGAAAAAAATTTTTTTTTTTGATTDAIEMPFVLFGSTVENHVIANAEGRLETPSWSINHIAWGEEVRLSWCY